jgi:hypothetical protein
MPSHAGRPLYNVTSGQGVYQIGEVQARSWIVDGPGRERALRAKDAVSRRHHARDLRARGLYSATRRAGAKTPRPFDEVSRRVRAGEPRPGPDCARDTRRRCH